MLGVRELNTILKIVCEKGYKSTHKNDLRCVSDTHEVGKWLPEIDGLYCIS